MVNFNELYITPDNKHLVIDVSVKDIEIYKKVYLDEIKIYDQDGFVQDGLGNNPLYEIKIEAPESLYGLSELGEYNDPEYASEERGLKYFKITLGTDTIPLNGKLLFVYVTTKGYPDSTTPCCMDNYWTLGVVYNNDKILHEGLSYMKETEESCSIPKNFIDFILKYKAFQLALHTGNYHKAILYWNKFYTTITSRKTHIKRCSCHHSV